MAGNYILTPDFLAAPIRLKAFMSCHDAGLSNVRSLGSVDAADWLRIGRGQSKALPPGHMLQASEL